MRPTLVLLPGLNGTDGLFQAFIDVVPEDVSVLPISYPPDRKLSYKELTLLVLEKVSAIDGEFILLGESFSGPIALFVAMRKPQRLLGVILVASFVTAPNVQLGRFLPWTLGFSLTKPLYALRRTLSTSGKHPFIDAISAELQKVDAGVLAHRIQQIFSVDATEALIMCAVPVTYFRGASDYVVPKGNLKKILSMKPEVQVVEFNTQHFLLQSEPKLAWDEINRFTDKCL